ncbi:unnamed protein product [Rhizophagus irregularis]|nr:unnamed protein product [Rhizophagus irregularis]
MQYFLLLPYLSSESISSYNVAEKRKFDELDKSDINSVNSLSDNESSLDNEDDNNNPSQEDYNGDNDNPSQDYNNYNEIITIYNEIIMKWDNKFNDIEDINDDELIKGLRLLHTKVLHSISDIAFNKILDNINSNLTIYKLKKKSIT